jgi:hypothetical protein
MSKTFKACIRFLPSSEGGRNRPAMNGIRPSLRLGDVFTSCVIHSCDQTELFEFGKDYDVTLEIVFWDVYGHLLRWDQPVELFEGSHLIAVGKFHPEDKTSQS